MEKGPARSRCLAGLLLFGRHLLFGWLLASGVVPAGAESPSPRRIISLAPSLTEVLFAVGAGAQVVGVTEFCNYPPEAAARPKVGGITPDTINLERILELAPDLVLSSGDGQDPALANLARLGIATRVLPAESLEEVMGTIDEVGALSGHAERARRLRAELEGRVDRIRGLVSRLPTPRVRVFYQVWDRPLMTTGRSYVSELIEIAGGENVFGDLTQAFPQVSEEAVLVRDPEVILIPSQHREPVRLEDVRRRPGWDRLSAVRSGRVHLLPGDPISRPGPRLVEVLETMARLLHPELFTEVPR